jgi:hypothetical protein
MGQMTLDNKKSKNFLKFIFIKIFTKKGLDLQSNLLIALRLRRGNPITLVIGFTTLKPEAVYA